MDRQLFDAAVAGHAAAIQHLLASQGPTVLLGTTPQGNTCLHIAAIHGHEGFCNDVLALDQQSLPLLTATNADGETPLLAAVTRGRAALASVLLGCCRGRQLRETILKKDKRGCNTLHHAIRRGHRMLALELIKAEHDLSKVVNMNNLLEIPDSAHAGPHGFNVLHAAVGNGNSVIAKKVMETRPWLARQENESKHTPMHMAAKEDSVDVLSALLEHDRSLGYLVSTDGAPLLCIAASQGHVGVARELLKHCPDAPYCDATGSTCLHVAVSSKQAEFVKFVLGSHQLQHLINMADSRGETALHLATADDSDDDDEEDTSKENKKIVNALRQHQHIDVTVLSNAGNPVPDDIASSGASAMDRRLLEAAVTGDTIAMQHLVEHVTGVLYGSTPQGNNCLHISAIHGHEGFCKDVLALNEESLPLLLTAINASGETPLLTAVTSGRVSVASVLLSYCRDQKLREAILKQDKHGFNALHHAIRSGHKDLALDLIAAEPALSYAVNKYQESAMFMAVMRNKYEDVLDELLKIPDSSHGESDGSNALRAAVRNVGSTGPEDMLLLELHKPSGGLNDQCTDAFTVIAKKIVETRPRLARGKEESTPNTPMHLAALFNKVDVLRVLLEYDRSLGYVLGSTGGDTPLLVSAAHRGHVDVAQELLKHCPDAPYCDRSGWTCLHEAVSTVHTKFVEFVLGSSQLRRLINMRDGQGQTALPLAVQKCDPKMVAALLLHQDIDVTVTDNLGDDATWKLSGATKHAKTLNWNEVSMLMLKADPRDETSIYNLHKQVKDKVTNLIRKDIKSLTQTYTGNTSLVAILIATITFAVAFTLPGGYSTDAGAEGLPIMARKAAFQAFLISDTLAMCSSLAVAFVCVIAKWEDLEFLLYYRSFTKKLMWFAYIATSTAFATGLYTVLAPRLLWLAIAVCVLTGVLPILTKLLGEWPILKLRLPLSRTFKSELLDMV
ncbi:protein ACCELERATED CELL DEATH 6-like isoform X1 [Panicum miliaceum]|uniref:Protein ACCELERATED CELL DEATH 6-like isoform X1 n=1 Tax=Panicum miliaceum TaxID=4540 RepID=A0A3L6PZ23_PANMI|nr:protein ACCELERATED CELL DEATH 6-like isoform X1 [Panicum miliaceum]